MTVLREPGGERSRRRRRVATLAAATVGISLGGAWAALWSAARPEHLPLPGQLPPAAAVRCQGPFPKQGPDECGAYSLAVGLRAIGAASPSPREMVARVSHTVPGCSSLSGTLPWRLGDELERRGLGGAQRTAFDHPPERRLDALRQHLAVGRPVLVLIESERGTQHYVLVVGYGPHGFDLYDPNAAAAPDQARRTVDANGRRPGNRTLSAAELTERWSRGGSLGLFGWWYLPIGSAQATGI